MPVLKNREKYFELGFNDYLVSHLENRDQKGILRDRCESPFYVLSSPLIERDIIPLWEYGTTIVYYNNSNERFEVSNLEDIDSVWESYSSIQGILAYLILGMWEDEISDDEIEETAQDLGFKYISELLHEAESTENYGDWRKQFPKRCT